jgi:hypothetical protein
MLSERPPLRVIRGGGGAAAPSRSNALPALELIGLGTGLVFAAVMLARVASWRGELGTFQALYGLAFAFYALALIRARRYRQAPMVVGIVLVVALAARIALLPVTPTLSDHLYRQLWDGKVVQAGENPYRLAPGEPRLASLRDQEVFPRLRHPERTSATPPLALAGFALVAALSPTVWAMKLWVMIHDLALVGLLLWWLTRRGENPVLALAYAWNPLVLSECAGNGHADPVALVWLVAALAISERRPAFAALSLALASLAQLASLMALPFLWRGWPRYARLLVLGVLLPGLALYSYGLLGGDSMAWNPADRNNELAFHYLTQWLGTRHAWAVVIVGLFWAFAWLAWRRDDPAYSTRSALRLGLLASPVAHPWHLTWPMALEPLGPSAPWILLSLTCVLSYGLLAAPGGGEFHLPLAWRWIEYGVPLLLAAVLAWNARRRREGRRPRRRP